MLSRKIILSLFIILQLNGISSVLIEKPKDQKQIDSVLNILQKSKRVEGQRIGIAAVKSYVYESAQFLWSIATPNELVELTMHKNPIIRCYAFLGLFDKKVNENILLGIALKHEKDSAIIKTFNGCIEGSFTIGYWMRMQATAIDPKIRFRFQDSIKQSKLPTQDTTKIKKVTTKKYGVDKHYDAEIKKELKPLNKSDSGYFCEKTFDGVIIKEGFKKHDLLDGEVRIYEQGKLINIFHYKEDVPHGSYAAFYYPSEKLYITGWFEEGKKEGLFVEYDMNGNVTGTKTYKQDVQIK